MLSDLECRIHGVYIKCLVYAGDFILLSASVGCLQRMLDICYSSGMEIGIERNFNAKKSSLFVVGKCVKSVRDIIDLSVY